MAVAQITRTTSGMAGPTSATTQTTINNLKTSIAAGNTITADHMNSLKNLWNSFNNHYHTTLDQWFAPTGNANTYNTAQYDTNPENTSALTQTTAANYADITWTVAAGETISATTHADLRAKYLQANGHWHTIVDRTS